MKIAVNDKHMQKSFKYKCCLLIFKTYLELKYMIPITKQSEEA